MHNAMAQDFSWGRQTLKYEQIYRDVIGARASNNA